MLKGKFTYFLTKTHLPIIMNYRELCEQTIAIVKEAALFISKEYENFESSQVRFKDKNDLVSYVDVETENFLKAEFFTLNIWGREK